MNHEFNSLSMSDAAIYHSYTPHTVKNKGSIIGGRKVKPSDYGEQLKRKAFKCKTERVQLPSHPMCSTTLRPVSPKQAHRNYELRKKFKRMLVEIELHGEDPRCQMCGKACGKLVVDHVGTRNQNDADRFENLGILGWGCNSAKGSVRKEYRPQWFINRMKELDNDRNGH